MNIHPPILFVNEQMALNTGWYAVGADGTDPFSSSAVLVDQVNNFIEIIWFRIVKVSITR